jgi:transcriptional regulator with XRE-family HTH domain
MEKLAKLLKKRMKVEGLAVRDVADITGVSHSTIARAANNETVTVSTLVALCDFLGVPLRSVLDTKETPDEVFEQISRVVAIEPELKSVFTDIARKINEGKLDKKVLSEIAAFAAFRISQYENEPIKEKQEAKVVASKV